jgi:hypothetical protein
VSGNGANLIIKNDASNRYFEATPHKSFDMTVPRSLQAFLLFSCLPSALGWSPSNPAQSECERRTFLIGSVVSICVPTLASAKCTDIESCREIGEKKVEQDLKDNPIIRLENGGAYKQIKVGYGDKQVAANNLVDLIYSITSASGAYMYSQGFGFEKVDVGNNNGVKQSDLGLDSYRVPLGEGNLPSGVEQALIGIKKGERRRVVVPPNLGFETSNWKPEPTTRRGKASIVGYKNLLKGNGSTQPPFPAPTIWDVEVLSFR